MPRQPPAQTTPGSDVAPTAAGERRHGQRKHQRGDIDACEQRIESEQREELGARADEGRLRGTEAEAEAGGEEISQRPECGCRVVGGGSLDGQLACEHDPLTRCNTAATGRPEAARRPRQ